MADEHEVLEEMHVEIASKVPFSSLTRIRVHPLIITPSREQPDGVVLKAVDGLKAPVAEGGYGGEETMREVQKHLELNGQTELVLKATAKLNASGVDRVQRLLLSTPGVYATLIKKALDAELDLSDTSSLISFVMRRLEEADTSETGFIPPRVNFVTRVLVGALRERGIDVSYNDIETRALYRITRNALLHTDIPTRSLRAVEVVLKEFDKQRDTGLIAAAVEDFANSGEIEKSRFSAKVKQSMVQYLKNLGVQFNTATTQGVFDEYLALAYDFAVRGSNGQVDTFSSTSSQLTTLPEWDFTVDTFETAEEEGVVPEHIRAAGALYYIYQLGERLGIYRLVDAVVLRAASGNIDLAPGPTADLLESYMDRRKDYPTAEDRSMLYKRVFNTGGGKLLSGMIANDEFETLWANLMKEIAEFIRRQEEKARDEIAISRQPIVQATRQLAYNVSGFMTPLAPRIITKMYKHLLDARRILELDEIVDYFGAGRRKTLWTVLERGLTEWLNEKPNITAIRTLAVSGNTVFNLVADYDGTTLTREEWIQQITEHGESWILAQAADAGETGDEEEAEEDEFGEDEFEEVDEEADEFDRDWDK